MKEKRQFDEFLGGNESLPSKVHAMKFLSARAPETAACTNAIESRLQSNDPSQKLPANSQRRLMSHIPNKRPRRFQAASGKRKAESELTSENKRPCRRYRRKASNLLKAFNRREKEYVWLETHIWHAKRFHMIDKWGYRLAHHSNNKCYKQNYKVIKNGCLMQDISYYSCVEITGPQDFLISNLKMHCDLTRRTFGAEDCRNGEREETIMFYKKNGFPSYPMGNVSFFYRPPSAETEMTTIWIWLHPAIYNEIFEELIASFNFVPLNAENCLTIIDKENMSYINNNNNCQMKSLKGLLNRFRLCGPSAARVITRALSVYDPNTDLITESAENVEAGISENMERNRIKEQNEENIVNESTSTVRWHMKYYNNKENLNLLIQQNEFWKYLSKLQTPNHLPPRMVCAFTVVDPRFRISHELEKKEESDEVYEQLGLPPDFACFSPIWEKDIRDEVTENKPTTNSINKLRSQCVVPGVQNDKYFDPNLMIKIPILLIQYPGRNMTGFSSYLDIILPADWAMPFWVSLVYNCAKVGALRESESIILENSDIKTLSHFDPDTLAYKKQSQEDKSKLIKRYFELSTNTRPNFIKLGISCPFFCEWKILVKEWSNNEDFCILRNYELLCRLEEKFNKKSKYYQDLTLDEHTANILQNSSYLVCVKVKTRFKGKPNPFSIICMPTEEDLKGIENKKSWPGALAELKNDPNVELRKVARENHQMRLKRLKKRKKCNLQKYLDKENNASNEMQLMQEKEQKIHSKWIETEIREYKEKVEELWLPKCSSVRHSCDREVMGYVTKGGLSYFDGHGVGIGYITIQSFMKLSSNVVLIRNTTTRQYRTAKLELIISI